MSAWTDWLFAFVFTQIVEVPIYRRALQGRFWVAFGASAITHPLVVGLLPQIWPWSVATLIITAESLAVVVEAVWLRAWGLRRAFWWSLIANMASFSLGMLCHFVFGRP